MHNIIIAKPAYLSNFTLKIKKTKNLRNYKLYERINGELEEEDASTWMIVSNDLDAVGYESGYRIYQHDKDKLNRATDSKWWMPLGVKTDYPGKGFGLAIYLKVIQDIYPAWLVSSISRTDKAVNIWKSLKKYVKEQKRIYIPHPSEENEDLLLDAVRGLDK